MTQTPVRPQNSLETVAHRESPSMAQTIASDIGIAIARAEGSLVWDESGREYLDLTAGSGVMALGHGYPAMVAAMRDQLGLLVHGGWQFSCPARSRLSEELARALPWDDPVLLWCTTGSEAVEAALKVARAASGRRQVLGFLGGYHGKTAGALAVTANSTFRAGVTEVPVAGLSLPYPVASGYVPGGAPTSSEHQFGQQILEHPDFGSEAVAGLIVECVQGAGGMQAAAPGFLTELRSFTERNSMLLIVDEIFTGFGRTGATFGFDHEGVIPNLVVLGKALGGGLPVSLVAGPRELLGALPPLRQTSTFSANPMACAAGSVLVDVLEREQLPAQAAGLGAHLEQALRAVTVAGVRVETIGRGLMLGARIAAAPSPDCGAFTKAAVRRMREHGVVALRGGTDGSVVKWTPPLTITTDELDRSVDAFAAALAATSSDPGGLS